MNIVSRMANWHAYRDNYRKNRRYNQRDFSRFDFPLGKNPFRSTSLALGAQREINGTLTHNSD